MEEISEEALYGVSRWSVMAQRELSTLATLPRAKAKARSVSSTSGVVQQLEGKQWQDEKKIWDILFFNKDKLPQNLSGACFLTYLYFLRYFKKSMCE